MGKPIKRALILLAGLLLFGLVFFVPRGYNVASFAERNGTQYWHLNTGSKIGYTKVETKVFEKKPPIIYLHGGPGGFIKDEVIEVLSPLSSHGHDLYFYDQIGSGHSARLKDINEYSVTRHTKDLKEILFQIGADKVILIGQSWGACLAVNFLSVYPEVVNKVILTGPGPILPINRAAANTIPPDSINLIAPEFTNEEGNRKVENWRSKIISKWAFLFHSKLATDKEMDDFFTFLNEELRKSTDCIYEEQERYPGGSGYYSHIMTVKSFGRVENNRNKLSKLETPVLILRGQCDNQKWGYTKEYLDLLVNARLKIIEGVGHDIIRKQQETYYDLILDFLSNE